MYHMLLLVGLVCLIFIPSTTSAQTSPNVRFQCPTPEQVGSCYPVTNSFPHFIGMWHDLGDDEPYNDICRSEPCFATLKLNTTHTRLFCRYKCGVYLLDAPSPTCSVTGNWFSLDHFTCQGNSATIDLRNRLSNMQPYYRKIRYEGGYTRTIRPYNRTHECPPASMIGCHPTTTFGPYDDFWKANGGYRITNFVSDPDRVCPVQTTQYVSHLSCCYEHCGKYTATVDGICKRKPGSLSTFQCEPSPSTAPPQQSPPTTGSGGGYSEPGFL